MVYILFFVFICSNNVLSSSLDEIVKKKCNDNNESFDNILLQKKKHNQLCDKSKLEGIILLLNKINECKKNVYVNKKKISEIIRGGERFNNQSNGSSFLYLRPVIHKKDEYYSNGKREHLLVDNIFDNIKKKVDIQEDDDISDDKDFIKMVQEENFIPCTLLSMYDDSEKNFNQILISLQLITNHLKSNSIMLKNIVHKGHAIQYSTTQGLLIGLTIGMMCVVFINNVIELIKK